MKFIFFNLVAVIAILYLVAVDGKPMKSIPDYITEFTVSDDRTNGEELAERARQKLEGFKKNFTQLPDENFQTMKQNKVAAPIQNKLVEQVARQVAPPESKIKEVAVRKVNKVPKTPAKAATPLETKVVHKFMSRADRRRELSRLAQDMEMMFADKLAD